MLSSTDCCWVAFTISSLFRKVGRNSAYREIRRLNLILCWPECLFGLMNVSGEGKPSEEWTSRHAWDICATDTIKRTLAFEAHRLWVEILTLRTFCQEGRVQNDPFAVFCIFHCEISETIQVNDFCLLRSALRRASKVTDIFSLCSSMSPLRSSSGYVFWMQM